MIEFKNVHKTYKKGSEALRGVSFVVEDGEFVFLIGKSGSGKSTLMKCITCEEIPSEGSVEFDGFDITTMSRKLVPTLRRQLGMIFQDFRLIESKTVAENIAFAGEIVGVPRRALNQTVQLVLNIVGLKDKAESLPQELSGGEQQRVAIARAMVSNPKIIIADEPTGNLDPETSENIMALLQDINNSGTTVIVCTHDSNLVDRMKKRVIAIDNGLIVRDAEASSYDGKEKPEPEQMAAQVAPAMDINFSFGDDPAFEHDSDYKEITEEDSYQNLPSDTLSFGDEIDVKLPDNNVAESIEHEIPEEAIVFEDEDVKMSDVEMKDEDASNEAPEILFGNSEEQKSVEEEIVETEEIPEEEPIETSEEWLNKIDKDLEESDIDLDISEDD